MSKPRRIITPVKWLLSAIALIAAPVLLTGCQSRDPAAPVVRDIEGEAGPTLQSPSELRFTVKGGTQDLRLNNVFSPMVIETRIYRADGTMLEPGEGIAIPAGETVRFGAKGEPRVELVRVNRVPRQMEKIDLNFVFSNSMEQFATAPFITPEGAETI